MILNWSFYGVCIINALYYDFELSILEFQPNSEEMPIKPPVRARPTRRLKKNRAIDENGPLGSTERRENKCTLCGKLGNNKRRCQGGQTDEERRITQAAEVA